MPAPSFSLVSRAACKIGRAVCVFIQLGVGVFVQASPDPDVRRSLSLCTI